MWFKVACQLLPTAKYDEDEVKNALTLSRLGIVSMHACKRKTSANTRAPHSRPRLFSICSVQFYYSNLKGHKIALKARTCGKWNMEI